MARYLVTVTTSPDHRHVGSRYFNALDHDEARAEGYHLATAILQRRRMAKYACQWKLQYLSGAEGRGVVIHHVNYVDSNARRPARRMVVRRPEDGG